MPSLLSLALALVLAGLFLPNTSAQLVSTQVPFTQSAPAPFAGAQSTVGQSAPAQPAWEKLNTAPYRGKQDDIFFITPETGWYVNGAGKIYKTSNGGAVWTEQLSKPGTFFRCIGFIDSLHGFAGNIGTDYFPNVSDTIPLYETTNGGQTWNAVTSISGASLKGLCAIDILKVPFINAGFLDYKPYLYAGGRVGSPAVFVKSIDAGKSWQATDMSKHCAMILDVHFFSPDSGILCAGTDANIERSNALILLTADGGKSWKKTYQSTRPFELTWKASFPTRQTGYVTVQNYNPDTTDVGAVKMVVAKTSDGGQSWKEVLLTKQSCREFGVGFADERRGWVGTLCGGFETADGGATWKDVPLGRAVNKIRILKSGAGFACYAIGIEVRKLVLPK